MAIGDEYVNTGDAVVELIRGKRPGQRVRVLFRRDGRQLTTVARAEAFDALGR